MISVREVEEDEEKARLHGGKPEIAHAFVERLAKQAAAVGQKIADVVFHARRYNNIAYYCKLQLKQTVWQARQWRVRVAA